MPVDDVHMWLHQQFAKTYLNMKYSPSKTSFFSFQIPSPSQRPLFLFLVTWTVEITLGRQPYTMLLTVAILRYFLLSSGRELTPNLSIGKTRLLSTLQLSWVREGKGVEGGGAGIRGVVGGGLGCGWWPLGGWLSSVNELQQGNIGREGETERGQWR